MPGIRGITRRVCGIGGCVCPPGRSPSRELLRRLIEELGHRGPDDRGVLIKDTVGLVNTRLAILDPTPSGSQPMEDPDRGWAITYNGEVFNHVELRRRVRSRGFNGHSDTETVLAASAEWGEEAPSLFNGFFAFAALDREGQRLLLVRDRFGVKPLYFTFHEGAFWFASEIKALLAVGVPRRPREEFLSRMLLTGWVNGPETPVAGVNQLLPGTSMTVHVPSLRTATRVWYYPAASVDGERQAELAKRSRAELTALFERELTEAVGRELISDVPVGTMCSGGIDSSLLTAFARDRSPDIVAFNAAIAGGRRLDESRWAERVATALGIELRTVRLTPESWRGDFVQTVHHLEYPFTEESAVSIAAMAAEARRAGVKALISGEGADELFGGYFSLSSVAGFVPRASHLAYWRDALRRMTPAERARAAVRVPRVLRRLLVPDRYPAPLLAQRPTDLSTEAEFERLVEQQTVSACDHHSGSRGALERELLGLLSRMLPFLLNRLDKNGMEHSVEIRPPFLDPRVVELVTNLPLETRITPRPKGILRDLAMKRLPRAVATRPKQPGMRIDPRSWFQEAARPSFLRDGRLRDVLQIPLATWDPLIEGLQGRRVMLFWSAEVWCRTLLDSERTAAVESELWL